MRRFANLLACAVLAACGNHGGADAPPATADAVRLAADGASIGGAQYDVEVGVQVRVPAGVEPTLLAVTIDVPPALTVLDPGVRAATGLVDLERGGSERAVRVLAGDARNVDAIPLREGPLFWLRVAPTLPRTPGTHRLTLRNLEVASRAGALLPTAAAPTYVDVVVE